MDEKGFVENGFIINLSNAKNAAEVIYELSNMLEVEEAKNKNICLKLGNTDLTKSQLLSIKSLISSMDSELAFVDTDSDATETAALNLGIIISELTNEIEVEEETEAEDADIYEIEVGEPKDGLSYEVGKKELVQEEEPEIIVEDDIVKEFEEKLNFVKIEDDEDEKQRKEEEKAEKARQEAGEKEIVKLPTLYLRQTLRSGQTMSFDGNVVLVGDTNPGSEIIAKGDIAVWGILGGIAHAGARGNDYARIRALKLNAIQLRISGYYARRPDSSNIPFVQKTNEFTPEEARVSDKAIAVFKVSE